MNNVSKASENRKWFAKDGDLIKKNSVLEIWFGFRIRNRSRCIKGS